MSFQPPPGFWKNFAEEIWDKQPRVFKQLFEGRLLAPQEELFRVVAETTARYAPVAGDWMKRAPFRMSVDKGSLSVQVPYVPRHEDGSFEGWAQRLYKEQPGRSFLFHINGVQTASSLLFERYREFTEGLVEHVGLPSWRLDADLFVGNYRETPFGVHKDMAQNFALIISGRKRLLLWPYETLLPYAGGSLDPRELDFALQVRGLDAIREPPIVLEGEPGDVFYWPGHFWHCAQGTGSLSLTNNLAFYTTGNPMLHRLMEQTFEKVGPLYDHTQPVTPYVPARRQELASAVPQGMRDSTQQMVAGLKQWVEGGLERELELMWMQYVSGGGFSQVPPPASDVVLDETQAMKLAPRAGLVWRKLNNGELAFAANGLASCQPESGGLVELLHRLSSGGAHRVGALLDEVVEERQGNTVVWSRERMREVLTTLVAQRALIRA